jgi:hypothetical protein
MHHHNTVKPKSASPRNKVDAGLHDKSFFRNPKEGNYFGVLGRFDLRFTMGFLAPSWPLTYPIDAKILVVCI